MITVLTSLCPLALSACSAVNKPPSYQTLSVFLQPTVPPDMEVNVWGDYPPYVERLRMALSSCNVDKSSARAMTGENE